MIRAACQIAMIGSLLAITQGCFAAVVEFTSRPAWELAAGEFTTIDFLGFPPSTIITTQYQSSGLHFSDGNDIINNRGTDVYPQDGSGLRGAERSTDPDLDINVLFLSPQFSIGLDYPGAVRIELYSEGELVYTSSDFGGTGSGFFAGLISSDPFDFAILHDWNFGAVSIDDLHFGVPSPGALPLIGIALLLGRRRRRPG